MKQLLAIVLVINICGSAVADGAIRVDSIVPGDAAVGAWLMVETQVAAATGLASRNLSLALLAKVKELLWPI